MTRNFFRRVGFGLRPEQDVPSDALEWAKSQVNKVPEYQWTGHIPSTLEGRDFTFSYNKAKKKARQKFKNDPKGYEKLFHKPNQEKIIEQENINLKIRYSEALIGDNPVYDRLLWFWGNHFAIIEKFLSPELFTGPYQREVIRANLTGNFENLVREVTTSWAMLDSLDNRTSIAPNSAKAKKERKKGRTPTLNENHARELLELHTISPSAKFTQNDVINTAYIMAGWGARGAKGSYSQVKFSQDFHEPGEHIVLGKGYKQRNTNSKLKLFDLIADLVRQPSCREFISTKLCRHFITDNPTKEMVQPIIKTWEKTDGDLPSIHKTLLEVVYEHCKNTSKLNNPELWLIQTLNLYGSTGLEFSRISNILEELGQSPFRPLQPNGWSDLEEDWVSPEFLIRRLVFSRDIAFKRGNYGFRLNFDLNDLISKNFHDKDNILSYLSSAANDTEKLILLSPSKWMLYS